MFVPVINLHVSNLRSIESRIISFSYKAYQNVGKFTEFSDSDKKKKCLLQ